MLVLRVSIPLHYILLFITYLWLHSRFIYQFICSKYSDEFPNAYIKKSYSFKLNLIIYPLVTTHFAFRSKDLNHFPSNVFIYMIIIDSLTYIFRNKLTLTMYIWKSFMSLIYQCGKPLHWMPSSRAQANQNTNISKRWLLMINKQRRIKLYPTSRD